MSAHVDVVSQWAYDKSVFHLPTTDWVTAPPPPWRKEHFGLKVSLRLVLGCI